LVHGAWADGSSWNDIIAPLQAKGLNVMAAPIPLTSLSDDVAALDRALERTDGPIVLAAHAYAGAVIGKHQRASPVCCYVPFTDIGSAVMKMLADTHCIKIDHADEKELTEKFSTMPPYPEVPAALRKLRNAGFRLFTLTDNLLEVQTRQLEHGGIADLFELASPRTA
jgi:hypothetical protein